MIRWTQRGLMLAALCILGVPIGAQELGARYFCVAEVHASYSLPEEDVTVKRGEEAACTIEAIPRRSTWETDCPFFDLTANDQVDVLSFSTTHGFWTVTLVAINSRTTSVRVLRISKLADRDDIQFSLTAGGSGRYGRCRQMLQ